jgi:hypothetical protein
MFPATVRAAVLDGATDPDADYMKSGLDQAKGFENQFTQFRSTNFGATRVYPITLEINNWAQ